ncbi:transposase [Pseudomonas orientalis]|uniref:transposase n=1 Tax=Pseudomonas orientalis TaxID=76758 RepID=UPI003988453D
MGGRLIAALAGLAPYNNDSGRHKGARHISGGRFSARRSLYMACWVVIRDQPEFGTRYKALRDKGKCAKVALIACMRVLLVRLNAMLRDRTEWKERTASAVAAISSNMARLKAVGVLLSMKNDF